MSSGWQPVHGPNGIRPSDACLSQGGERWNSVPLPPQLASRFSGRHEVPRFPVEGRGRATAHISPVGGARLVERSRRTASSCIGTSQPLCDYSEKSCDSMSPRTFTLLMSLLVGLLAGASHRLGNYSASTGQHPLASMPVSDVDESASERTEQAEKATPSVRIILPSPFEVRSN
jgi:hypothetical protein